MDIDPVSDYSRIQRNPYHKWTIPHHVTLAFLVRMYQNPWNDIADVFNKYFSSELQNPNRLSSGALASMYHDMNRGKTGKKAIRLLRETAFSFTKEPTFVDKESIERIASELGIHLIESLPGALSRGTQTPKKLRRAKRKVALDDDSEHESTPRTPNKRQHLEQVPQTPNRHGHLSTHNGLLTPPATVQQSVLTPNRLPVTKIQPWSPAPKRLPPVAYRAFSSQSQGSYSKEQGFCAGAFVGSDVPLPPNPQSQEYIDEAKRVNKPFYLSSIWWRD